jgi:predicted DNA-binding transcriptional regulator YafY
MRILLDKTDEEHSITMSEILENLQNYGISAERKSIYDDIESLRLYGLEIECIKSKTYSYHIVHRQFELPELKLLVDAVQSSKFITHKKTNDLIKKIESLASTYEASKLQRQVYVAKRIKTQNESIYYNVDKIHEAISVNVRISFQYFEWTIDKQMIFRKDGERYIISPWALTWADENYYMVGYDDEGGIIKHYRVDKMKDIQITDIRRQGKEQFKGLDMAVYSKRLFGMYGGKEETVKLQFENKLVGVVIDQFGKEIQIRKEKEDHFTVNVKIEVSQTFLGWIFGLGSGVKILSPVNVVEQMQRMVDLAVKIYK